jgi:hypothetical protein
VYLIPRTAIPGAVLLTGFLGGAVLIALVDELAETPTARPVVRGPLAATLIHKG